MMTTALLIFLGLSSCATLTIVSCVMLGARRARVAYNAPATEASGELATNGGFLPVFSH